MTALARRAPPRSLCFHYADGETRSDWRGLARPPGQHFCLLSCLCCSRTDEPTNAALWTAAAEPKQSNLFAVAAAACRGHREPAGSPQLGPSALARHAAAASLRRKNDRCKDGGGGEGQEKRATDGGHAAAASEKVPPTAARRPRGWAVLHLNAEGASACQPGEASGRGDPAGPAHVSIRFGERRSGGPSPLARSAAVRARRHAWKLRRESL